MDEEKNVDEEQEEESLMDKLKEGEEKDKEDKTLAEYLMEILKQKEDNSKPKLMELLE